MPIKEQVMCENGLVVQKSPKWYSLKTFIVMYYNIIVLLAVNSSGSSIGKIALDIAST